MYTVKRGLIVSCQDTFAMKNFCTQGLLNGAVALRLRLEFIKYIKEIVGCTEPVIGLTKDMSRKITLTYNDMHQVWNEGADYIATGIFAEDDADEDQVRKIYFDHCIADIATVEQAKRAQDAGCCAVTTALSGYTGERRASQFDPPDLSLVKQCSSVLDIPVIAEGRYWTVDQVTEAIKCGAHSVCIGTAINRPDMITKRFVERIEKCF